MKASEVKDAFAEFREHYENCADLSELIDPISKLDKAINVETPKMVKVSQEEYDKMQKRLDWLDCLEAAGVDCWCGIEEAIRIKKESDETP
jgi:hypothetical protein